MLCRREEPPGIAQHPGAAPRHRLVRAAGEVAFLEPEIREHPGDQFHVFRFPAMRGTGDGDLLLVPAKGLEPASRDERHELEWLGAGAPGRDERGIPGRADEARLRVDDGRMHPVARFHVAPAGDGDVEVVCLHDLIGLLEEAEI